MGCSGLSKRWRKASADSVSISQLEGAQMPQAVCQESRTVGVDGGNEIRTVEAFSTELGWMALTHEEDVLHGLVFGHASARQAEAALRRLLGRGSVPLTSSESHSDSIDDLRRFASGERVDFANVVVNVDHLTPFARRVTAACRRIPLSQT